MTPEHLLLLIQEAGSSEERRRILADAINSGEVDAGADLTTVLEWVRANAPEDADFFDNTVTQDLPRVDDRLKREATEATADLQERQSEFDEATDGRYVTPEERAAGEAEGLDVPQYVEPQWLLDLSLRLGFSGPLTDQQKQEYVDYVNFFYGQNFQSFEDMAASGYLDTPNAQNMSDAQSVLMQGEAEIPSFSWKLPSGDLFTVRADEWKTTQQLYGLDPAQLKGLINIADKLNLRNGPTRLNWQPVVALAKATNLLETLKPKTKTTIVGGPGSTDMGVTPIQVKSVTLEQNMDQAGTFNRPIGDNVNPNIIRGERLQIQTRLSFREVMEEFQKGLELFNYDPGMAYIYALDPTLAGRLASGGIPRGEDLYRLSGLVAEGGFKSSEDWRNMMVQMGYAEAERTAPDLVSNYLGWLDAKNQAKDQMDASRAAPEEPVRPVPDPARIDEMMRQLYREMFLQDPDEDTLARFRSRVTAAIQNAQPGEEIDVSARAQQFLREDPRYGQLYGNKPGGMDEAAYRNQFRTAQATMLGAELGDNESVMLGMRSGKFQTTIGAAAGTEQAWDNSTFLGRLARAAQVVGENT